VISEPGIAEWPGLRSERHGGAIALGHPLGSTGSRLVNDALNELIATNWREARDDFLRGRTRYCGPDERL